MAKLLRLFIISVFASSSLYTSAQEWARLTPEEKDRLERGEVIYKSVKTAEAEGKLSGYGQSLAIIKAPIEKCWELFIQFDKQAEYFPRKTVSQVLEQKPRFALVQKELSFYGVKIRYVMEYRIDEKNHRINFQIDQTKPHTIKDSTGFFQFEKISESQTLFIYGVTKADLGLTVPAFVQEYIQKKDLPAVAENVRRRIESGGTWKKSAE